MPTVRILQEMESMGVGPNVVSYNILIAVHAKQLQPGKAAEWLHAMQDTGITPDVVRCQRMKYAPESAFAGELQHCHRCLCQGEVVMGPQRSVTPTKCRPHRLGNQQLGWRKCNRLIERKECLNAIA